MAIGIDRYGDGAWGRLHNAVSDARGARDAFVKLGFQEYRPPLLDEAATGAALRRLVTDELRRLGSDDSLVLFFAGHGHTVSRTYDGAVAKRGYLIPADAEPPGASEGTWVSLDSWLHEVAHLPPKHILVVVDACKSGVALNSVIRWRGEDIRRAEPLATLRARQSRRVITSALDNELAMDGGPMAGHSLFTGCLIEALSGGLLAKLGQPIVTGSEIALHVQRRVSSYPNSHQTPDFGALELDNRGELLIELIDQVPDLAPKPPVAPPHPGLDGLLPRKQKSAAARPDEPADTSHRTPISSAIVGARTAPLGSGIDSIRPKRAKTDPSLVETPAETPHTASGASTPIREPRPEPDPPPASAASTSSWSAQIDATPPLVSSQASPPVTTSRPPSESDPRSTSTAASGPKASAAEAAFAAALDRHQAVRERGGRVLTLVTADPMTGVTGWASWAAARGHLTLVTNATGLGPAIASLLEQMPWFRVLHSARARLASATKLDANAVDGELDARSSFADREAWIDKAAWHDVHARVAGWLLSTIREPWGGVPEPATAPLQGGDLLAAICELGAPITVLLDHPEPTVAWLERAIQTAAELIDFLPRRAIAVSAPSELMSMIRGRPESAALALARRGEVPLPARAPRVLEPGRDRAVRALHSALARDARTMGLFDPAGSVPTPDRERAVEVDLIAQRPLLAVEIDDWYQFRDPKAYARDRAKDRWLSRAQFFVMRFLVEDIEERIEQTVNEIAIGLAGRRASGSFMESSNDR